MTLTVGDLAALTGMTSALMTALGVAVRYFVKAEIERAIGSLKLELAEDRAKVLAAIATAKLLEDQRREKE